MKTEHRVKITEDENGQAYGECQECCTAWSGRIDKVEQKADAHEEKHNESRF
jgi:hypothetical protein